MRSTRERHEKSVCLSIESSLEERFQANQHPVRGMKRIKIDPLFNPDERLMAPLVVAALTPNVGKKEDCV